jgi:hypothetical protein
VHGTQQSSANAREQYRRLLEERRGSLAYWSRRHGRLGNLRLAFVGAWALLAYFFWGWWLAAPAAFYFWLGSRLQQAESQRVRYTRAVAFYERSLARTEGRWPGSGESGTRFLDQDHLYARDLDLFGEASLFQLLCGARTRKGEETLAAWLLAPAPAEQVTARQEAVVELTARLDLREDLAVLGEDARKGLHSEELAAWGEREPVLRPDWFRWLARALSVFGVFAVIALIAYLGAWMGLLEFQQRTMSGMRLYFLSIAILYSGVLWRFHERTERIFKEAANASHDLALLAGVLERLEAETFQSSRLSQLRGDLDIEGMPPSGRMAQLDRLMHHMESHRNQVMAILGPLLLWDLHVSYALEGWRGISGRAMRRWLNAVGELEALSSLAGFRYENPDYSFPEFVDGSPLYEAEAMAHPLLGQTGVVANDVRLGGELRVLVVSGSNMSGKSTLLRTIGVNAVLAQAGAPVRARSLRLTPLSVGASIQVYDSLQAGESRFYAEITRLRQIMDRASGDVPVLFLIDEFLHGTNSHDRRIGAEAIVRGLVERGAIGLVTTHDLALAEIAETLGSRGANIHFEDHLEDGRMRFDYRIRAGIVRKSNAIELMRSVGLDV